MNCLFCTIKFATLCARAHHSEMIEGGERIEITGPNTYSSCPVSLILLMLPIRYCRMVKNS